MSNLRNLLLRMSELFLCWSVVHSRLGQIHLVGDRYSSYS